MSRSIGSSVRFAVFACSLAASLAPAAGFTVTQNLVCDACSDVPSNALTVAAGGSATFNFTATNCWISSVYTNGAPIGRDFSAQDTTSCRLVLTNLASDVDIVVATSKTRLPVAHKWYEEPGAISVSRFSAKDSCGGWSWGKDADDSFFALPWGFASGTLSLYSVDALEAGLTDSLGSYATNTFSTAIRGATVNKALNVMVVGSITAGQPILSLPVNVPNESEWAANTNVFRIYNDRGIVPGALAFTPDGQFLYTDGYAGAGDNQYIYKFAVKNGLKSSGTNLSLVASWDAGRRVRDFVIGRIGEKDIAYFTSNKGAFGALDTSDGSVTNLGTVGTGNYDGIAVGGFAAGTPHLYILNSASEANTTNSLVVYQLATNGLSLAASDPIKQFSHAEINDWAGLTTNLTLTGNSGVSLLVSDDEKTLVLGTYSNGAETRDMVVVQYAGDAQDAAYTAVHGTVAEGTGASPIDLSGGASTSLVFQAKDWYRYGYVTGIETSLVAVATNAKSVTVGPFTNRAAFVVTFASKAPAEVKLPASDGTVVTDDLFAWIKAQGYTEAQIAAGDGDGIALGDEYLLGTDPTADSTNSFAISGLSIADGKARLAVRLTRQDGGLAVSGAIHGALTLLSAPGLTNDWTAVGATTLSNGTFSAGDEAAIDLDAPQATGMFYKARIQ